MDANQLREMDCLTEVRSALANGYRNRKYGASDTPAIGFGYWLALLLPKQRGVLDAVMRHLPIAAPVRAGHVF